MIYFILEIRHWLRQPMTWVFLAINTLLIFGATSSDTIVVGGSFGNILKNAPFVIQQYYAVMSIITLLMTTAFVSAAALRDYSYNTYQIIFATPVNRIKYLGGRFFGAIFASMIPMAGVSLGILLGSIMPWVDPETVGPVIWKAHLHGWLYIGLPNTLFTGSIIFLVAAISRNSMTTFISSLVLLVLTVVAGELADDLEMEWLSILTDPYGASTFDILTKYWTVSDKNARILEPVGLFLVNRVLWVIISLIFTTITISGRFLTDKKAKHSGKQTQADIPTEKHVNMPDVTTLYNGSAHFRMFTYSVGRELKDILKSPAFIVILLAGLLNFVPSIFLRDGAYGLTSYPVTWWMINIIQGNFYLFMVAIITIYTGQLVWKEREAQIDEIFDATPHPLWVTWLSKLTAVAALILIVQSVLIFFCVMAQYAKGFQDIRLDVYLKQLVLIDFTGFLLLSILSFFIHTIFNNKYIAFFVFIVFLILNSFIWGVMDVESNMVAYGQRPGFIYSDMNGFGPYVKGILWFKVYWTLFAGMLAVLTLMLYSRGKEHNLKAKWKALFERFTPEMRRVITILFIAWIGCAGFVFYNTKVMNKIITSDTYNKRAADYEKMYKKYEHALQPRITSVKYHIDLRPYDRSVEITAQCWMKNKGDHPIDSIFISMPEDYQVTVDLGESKLLLNDSILQFRIYRLEQPLQPGDSLPFNFSSQYHAKGFENEVSYTSIVDNGSFFNSADFSPAIGYQEGGELSDKGDRKDFELPPPERMPKLRRDCGSDCMNNYISNHADWVRVESIISTEEDQIAIAPGSLVRNWNEKGRNYYHYKIDREALYFYSFISARYEVVREKYKGVDVEVYYDKKHSYNVDKMVKSMKRSLDYYTEHFGPYYQKQMRIIEFPRYASFAQAFPGTMPYSEAIGFIARIEDEADIDMVFYVVAHEMAHQYWAHQVIGAGVQGATVLSESLSQYSALMVMEKEYGRDKMKKFMKYEMDNYLNNRGNEELKEMPLMLVENQGYIHYRKASLIFYYLKEMIGEEKINSVLAGIISNYGYKEPPYPTVYVLTDGLKSVIPDSLQYLMKDLFETITVFNNRAISATATPSDGKYVVNLEYETHKFRADSLGNQTEIPVNDWVEIGVYGKSKGDEEIGKKLYSGMHLITKAKGLISVTVDEIPSQAGIDPRNLMVDLVSDDNLVKVKKE